MLRFNKRVDYGILILTMLGRGDTGPLSAAEISRRFQISRNMVSNILKDLARAELVSSVRGARGGYSLTRDPERITLTQIVEALEGPFGLLDCCAAEVEAAPAGCSTTSVLCTARPVIQGLNSQVRGLMDAVTVASFNPDGIGIADRV